MADEQTVAVPVEGATEDEKTSSKKGAKKQQKEAEKAKRKAETAAKLQAEAAQRDSDDCSVGNYGNLPLIQSTEQSGRLWTNLVDVSEAQVGKTVLIRARLHTSRGTGSSGLRHLHRVFRLEAPPLGFQAGDLSGPDIFLGRLELLANEEGHPGPSLKSLSYAAGLMQCLNLFVTTDRVTVPQLCGYPGCSLVRVASRAGSISGCPRCWLYQWLPQVLALSVVAPGAGSISGWPRCWLYQWLPQVLALSVVAPVSRQREPSMNILSTAVTRSGIRLTVLVIREAQRQDPVIKLVAQALQKSYLPSTQHSFQLVCQPL
eukprot:Em0024g51a